MTENEALAKATRDFLATPAGLILMNRLNTLYANRLSDATKTDKESAWGLLKNAQGIQDAIDEINRIKVMDKTKKGEPRT